MIGCYEGEINNSNQRHGMGKFTYDDGDIFIGTWLNDKRHGQGKMIYSDGDIFSG